MSFLVGDGCSCITTHLVRDACNFGTAPPVIGQVSLRGTLLYSWVKRGTVKLGVCQNMFNTETKQGLEHGYLNQWISLAWWTSGSHLCCRTTNEALEFTWEFYLWLILFVAVFKPAPVLFEFIFVCGQIKILFCTLNEDVYLLQFFFLQWNKTVLDLIR